ncbi:MAG: LemA family protein [Oscillospiraceae bacterium]|nr:LemA family protein [Oscillospiraceae bacterium]
MTGVYIAIGVIAIILLWAVSAYNGLVKIRNMVREAFSTMDVFMKKRYDLIPNLVETVKGYAAHEAGTLEKVIKARNSAASATTVEGRIEGENALTDTLKSLFALSEAYPDLKANTNFMDLQRQLQVAEGDIANSRKYYNAVVRDYNTKIESFPSVIIASMFGFRHEPMFEINTAERENVKVQF